MRYSIEPRKRRYVKGYGFISKDKGIDLSKNFAKTAGKRILQKSAEATGNLIGNRIADKITAKPIKMM